MEGGDGKAGEEEKPTGLVGRLFGGGGKRYRAAKMGGELQMYYNDEVRAAPSNSTAAPVIDRRHTCRWGAAPTACPDSLCAPLCFISCS